jgi:hypothetical protein
MSQPSATTTIYPNGDFTLGFSRNTRFINTRKSSQASRGQAKGMTSYAKKMLRNACYAIEEGISDIDSQIGFYTLTLPALSAEEIYLIAKDWSEIVRKFFQELRRIFERKGETPYFAYCTEIQMKRSKAVGVDCPHLHWVAPAYLHGTKQFIVSSSTLRNLWFRMLKPYISEEISFNATLDSQIIKKSVSRYLSKYLSKSNSKSSDVGSDDKYKVHISAWWGMSKELREWIKCRLIKDSGHIAEIILDMCKNNLTHLCNYIYPIVVKSVTDNFEFLVGYVGNTNVKFYEEV